MHIPDGFIDVRTAAVTAAISVVGLTVCLNTLRRRLEPQRVPLIGLTAAFVFAAQMLNFPVAGGTSGHLIGAVLAAVLLGPSAAVLVISSVLILQCFMFADGGVTALGANIFNMALAAPIVGYGVYSLISRYAGQSLRGKLFGIAIAAWCSTVAAAIGCAGQLALSGTVSWAIVFPAMAGVHMLIGMGEAVITVLVIAAIKRTNAELLDGELSVELRPSYREFVGYGLIVSVGLAIFVTPFASSWPDGLEKVASALGFESKAAVTPLLSAPLPDYAFPWLTSAAASTIIAGAIGTMVIFVLAFLLARALTPKNGG